MTNDELIELSRQTCGDPTCALCISHSGPDCSICANGDDDDRIIHGVPA